MLPGFKKYVTRTRVTTPCISIRKNGEIAFNAGAVAKYDLDAYDYVMLYIHTTENRIAIQFTNNEKDTGLVKLHKRKGNFAMSCRSFLKLYDIDYSETKNFGFTWGPKEKTAIFSYADEDGTVATRKKPALASQI